MTENTSLDIQDDDIPGNWPENIKLQVVGATDFAKADVGPDADAVPRAWTSSPHMDVDVFSSRSWPLDVTDLARSGTRRPTSHHKCTALQDEAHTTVDRRDERPLPAVSGDVVSAAVAASSSSASSGWGEFCRICHEGGDRMPLLAACRCTGSMQHVHNDCLIRWILSSFNTHCEICLHRYRIGTTGMRLPHRWKLPATDGVERYHMMLCLVAMVVLSAVISFLVYVSTDEGLEARTYRNSPLAPALYTVYAVLGLVCVGLATAELHYTIWPLVERFRLTNMNLLVVPYDPDQIDADTLDAFSAEYVDV